VQATPAPKPVTPLSICHLELGHTGAGNASIEQLVTLIRFSHSLTHLSLTKCHDITQFGWRDLFKAIQASGVMTHLDLSENKLDRLSRPGSSSSRDGDRASNPLQLLAGSKITVLGLMNTQLTREAVEDLLGITANHSSVIDINV